MSLPRHNAKGDSRQIYWQGILHSRQSAFPQFLPGYGHSVYPGSHNTFVEQDNVYMSP